MFKKLALTTLAVVALASNALAASGGAMSLIPKDAVTVGVVKLGALRSSPLSSMLFQQTDKVSTDGDAEKFLRETGLKPSKDIDLLVVATTPKTALSSEANVLVAAEGRFDVERLKAALVARGAVQKNGYFLIKDTKHPGDDTDKPAAVAFPDDGLVLAGTEEAVAGALASRAAGGTTFLASSGLGRDAADIDSKASAWAVVDVARASRLTNAPRVPSNNQSATALQGAVKNLSTVAIWATDTGDALQLGAFGIASDVDTRGLIEDTLRGALAAMRLAAQDKAPDMVKMLRKFTVAQDGDKVRITGSIPAETMQKFLAKQKEQHSHATR